MQLSDDPETVAEISYFLALIYKNVNWRKMRNARATAYDIFEHRLEVASFNESIPSMLKKLCNGLDLQAPSIPVGLIETLDKKTERVLYLIRSWPQYFVYKSASIAKLLKRKQKPSYEEIKQDIIKDLKK